MINESELQEVLVKYKRDFTDVTWPQEKYKWQAVKHFQDNWDVNAEDFPAMLERSFAKTGNLLMSAGTYARAMIQQFARANPELVRSMFVSLFDEQLDLFQRMEAFKQESAERLEDDGARSHYQDENTISTYLWLRYPDTYYIYKWTECRNVSKRTSAGYRFKRGDYANNVRDHLEMYDAICRELQSDPDMRSLLDSQLTEDCYPDPELRTLTIDVGYYISTNKEDPERHDADEWWPSNEQYSPGLTADDWERLLQDKSIFTEGSLEIMKRLKDIGGYSSCQELAEVYGGSANFYNAGSSSLGRRVVEKTGCPVLPESENANAKWWPVLYTGRAAVEGEVGRYLWRLRDELSDALDRVDLSTVPLHRTKNEECAADRENTGHWWLIASPRQRFRFGGLAVGEREDWSLRNEQGTKRQIYQNLLDAEEGDLVVGYESAPVKKIVALGRIAAAQNGDYLEFEKTEGLVTPVDYQTVRDAPELADMEAFSTNMRGSLFKLTKEEYDAVIDLIRDANPLISDVQLDPYGREDFLSDVYMSELDYERIVGVLKNKKNMILQGAPGVGKTYAAKRFAWSIIGQQDNTRVEFVQFHQNYSYEDFVMGYRPAGDGFELKPGIFYEFCKRAENHPNDAHFFIIDEINRGNLSKIFGELLMLIERGYRGQEATLAYTGDPFSVPKNVHIIGMMNTADRSLAMIDYALRRRFSFVEMKPGFLTEGFQKYQQDLGSETFDELVRRVRSLNEEITVDPALGKGFCIGHSYFCEQESATDEWLRSVVDYDLIPMLEEYWFDDEPKVRDWKTQLRGVLQQ